MRWVSLSGLSVVSFVSAALMFSACGSSAEKKRPLEYAGGGEGGAGEAGPHTAGSSAGGDPTNEGGMTGQTGGVGQGSGAEGGALGASGETGSTAGAADGGAGGVGNVKAFHGLYIGPNGIDATGDGTAAQPFATLAKAASVAQSGDTIVFLNGVYQQVAGAEIPDGVDVAAETNGSVTLQGQAGTTLFSLGGTTRIDGIKFQSFGTVVSFAAGTTATGSLTIVNSAFVQCATACLSLSGDTKTTIEVAKSAVLANGGSNFARLTEHANLNLVGGVIQAFTGGNVFSIGNDASATIKDTSIGGNNSTAQALLLDQKATVTLDGVTVTTGGTSLITQKGESSLSVKGSELFSTNPTPYHCIRSEMNGVGSIEVVDSKLHACGNGISSTIPGSLTLTRVEMSDMITSGIDIGYGFIGVGGLIRITDTNIHDCLFAARIGNDSNLNDIKVRGSSFINKTSSWDTVTLVGSAASTVDLGTLADPGGNTFGNGNANQTALRNSGTGLAISAVGNTWISGQQGADANGHYVVNGPGAQLLEKNVSSGRNYVVPYQGASILLAQNP